MDIVLIGLALPGVENQAIDALRSALSTAGHSERFVPFDGFAGMQRTVHDALAWQPRVIGISLQTIESALATVVLTRLLRARGYRGRIVLGGHFATLNARPLLESDAGIDAIVRFAGEQGLTAIAAGALDHPDRAATVPGLLYRDPQGSVHEGAPAQWSSAAASRGTSRALPLPEHLGFAAADLIASQGCESRCAYCCIGAASELARREARHSGVADVGYHRRSVAQLAAEITALHHEAGARVFNFMDDNVLPSEPREVVAWADELGSALTRKGVGRVAMALQLRADAVDEHSAAALARLGVVRAYVGIDGYSASQLLALGRRAPADAGRHALDHLARHGVFCVANALLVGPTIDFASVRHEIEGLARIEHAPVHLLPIEVRAGTAYFQKAQRRGLVEGGFLHWHYRFADARTERMAQILTALPTRLAERSVPIALYDLGYNLGIARRLLPELALDRDAHEYASIAAAWNRDQIRLLRAAALVAERDDAQGPRALIDQELPTVTAFDRALIARADRALARVEAAVRATRKRPLMAHSRGRLLGAVAFSMSLAACSVQRDSPTLLAGTSASGAGGVAAVGGASGAGGIAAVGGATGTGGVTGAGSAAFDNPMEGSSGTLAEAGPPECSDPSRTEGSLPNGALPNTECGFCDHATFSVTFDSDGRATEFVTADAGVIDSSVHDCLVRSFETFCYPSLANTVQSFGTHCWIA